MTKRHLLLLLLLFIGGSCILNACLGCAQLDAWKSNLAYNHKTGEASTETKGASAGGQYTENKGLNVGLGDNTATVVIVGLTILALAGGLAAYKSVPAHVVTNKP